MAYQESHVEGTAGILDEGDRIRRLLDVGRELVSELDSEVVLQRILEEARALTGARYAALGVLNDERSELERFLTSGMDHAAHRAIGELPRGRGVLGVLIEEPRPLRLSNVGGHPFSYGFPPEHPPMRSFLGVPITIRGQAWGNLYLTEKIGGGEFTEGDEEAVVVLADWAAPAIENARLYEHSERRRLQSEHALQSLQAARDIADAISGINDLDQVLELIVKRGRALVDAQSVLIMLVEGDDLQVVASAGHASAAIGQRLPVAGSTSGTVLREGSARRVENAAQLLVAPSRFGVEDAHSALLVPMMHRGIGIGVLAAFDRGPDGRAFTPEDEQLLRAFGASASNAVAIKRSVESDRLRSAIAAADAERSRWARELHDQTLQSLGALRVLLASATRRPEPEAQKAAIAQGITDIEDEIANLRAIITDLRPSLLDDIGLMPAIESLLERRRGSGLRVDAEIELPDPSHAGRTLSAELETTTYRLVQEALTNVDRHAQATFARVAIATERGALVIEVQDDGTGFDPSARRTGFGLTGMYERVYLAGGTMELESGPGGTLVRAHLPLEDVAPMRSLSSA